MPRLRVDAHTLALMALLDFLLGLSIDEVAVRYRITRTVTENELRDVLLSYGFDPRATGR